MRVLLYSIIKVLIKLLREDVSALLADWFLFTTSHWSYTSRHLNILLGWRAWPLIDKVLNLLSVLILNQAAFLNFLWDLKLIVGDWLRGQLISLRDIPLILIKLRVRLILLNQFLSLFLGLISCLLFIFELVKQIRVFLLFSQASQSILEFIVNIKSFFLFFFHILYFFSLLFLLCISLLLVFIVWYLGSWLNMLPLIKIVNHWAWV